jgi:hypothetical protein
MALTNADVSLWELAHRLADSDPHKRYWLGLPLPVKDNIRLLLNEVLSYRLTSSLIMEKRRPGSDIPAEYFIRSHLDKIHGCIEGRSMPRRLLQFISVDRWDFWQWCRQTGYQLPDFWFSIEYQLAEDDEEDPEDAEPDLGGSPLPPREAHRLIRVQCRTLARELWGGDQNLPIAQVARQIQERGLANHYREKTVVNWIRSMAPPEVKGRHGRPKKT